MESLKDIISANTDIMGGLPVFAGTRVPVETLFFNVEKGITIDEFLEDFPSVSKRQGIAVLDITSK